MSLITLTTDFGESDGYVGATKGAILSVAPEAHLVDLSHSIPPQDIVHGAFVLAQATSYFPAGTIHLGVVDPGVGGKRLPICLVTGGKFFVGPDNGLFSLCVKDDDPFEVYHLTNKDYFGLSISHTFHGRDIFGPVAGHLAKGTSPSQLGGRIANFTRLDLPLVKKSKKEIVGEIIHIDYYGNLITNIRHHELNHLPDQEVEIRIGKLKIREIRKTYEEGKKGKPLALIGSHGFVEIAVPGGNAASQLRAKRKTSLSIKSVV